MSDYAHIRPRPREVDVLWKRCERRPYAAGGGMCPPAHRSQVMNPSSTGFRYDRKQLLQRAAPHTEVYKMAQQHGLIAEPRYLQQLKPRPDGLGQDLGRDLGHILFSCSQCGQSFQDLSSKLHHQATQHTNKYISPRPIPEPVGTSVVAVTSGRTDAQQAD
eukprot:COSAG05_NODE_66_length_22253_cov_14.954455_8_plen_161_part_00